MTRFVISAAALALAFAASGAANAQDAMRVHVGDLNVQSDAGAHAAFTRIRAASAQFCGGEGSRELAVQAAQHACVDRMSSKAVDSLNAPKVTALSGRQPAIALASTGR